MIATRDAPRRGSARRWVDPWPVPFIALAVAVTLAGAVGILPRWPGLVHLVALPPLDVIGDIGVLLVYAPNVPLFVTGALTSLVLRAVVLAALVGRLDRAGFLFALRFYAVVWPFALVAAGLLYASKAVLFYALFWFGLMATLLLVAATTAAPWLAPPSVRRGFERAGFRVFRLGTVGSYLLVLTILGFAADVGGGAAAVLLVPVSAAATWGAAWLLRSGADVGVIARRVGAAAAAGGLIAVFLVAETGPAGPPRTGSGEGGPGKPGSIMLMSGIDSSSGSGAILEIDPSVMGWTCEQTYYYSYAGPGDGQPQNDALCPITEGAPYGPEDTLRSRDELVPFLEAQVARMEPPAVVAGHSQGVWIVWQAAAEGRLDNVSHIVLVGAFTENPVQYPTAWEREPGRVGRLLLTLIEHIPRPGGTTAFEVDSPLGQEWLGHPDAIEETLSQPLPPGIEALSVASSFDLPLMLDTHRLEGATNACPVPVIHPNLPYSAEFQEAVSAFVDGRELPACPWWRGTIGPLFRHFTVPSS